MLRHSTRISSATPYGGDLSAIARLRQLDKLAATDTLSAAAKAALLGGSERAVMVSWEALVELESNRTGYDAALTATYLDGGASVPAVDADVSSSAVAYDGRRNPAVRLAVADVSLADESRASGPGAGLWGLAPGTTRTTVLPAEQSATSVLTGSGSGSGAPTTAVDGLSPYGGRAHVIPATRLVAGGLALATFRQSAYRIRPTAVGRALTATVYVRPSGGQVVARMRASFADAASGNVVTFASPSFTVPASPGAFVRVASTIDTSSAPVVGAYSAARDTATDATAYRRIRWELEILAGTTATALSVAAPEIFAGLDRGPLGGLSAASTGTGGVVLDYRFRRPDATPRIRTISRVDVHGEARFGHVTAARALGILPDGVSTVELGAAASAGRLSITFPAVQLSGVKVTVEETSSGDLGAVWIAELDPAYVLDVSSRVISAQISQSREIDPGSATLPLGNYEATSLDLDLENTDRLLSPSSNAMIGTSHRIETAVRVHYADPLTGLEAIEAIPAGVYWSTGWDAQTVGVVSIAGVDRIGRFGDVDVAEPVTVNADPATVIRAYALTYLDLDDDEISIALSSGYVFPYLFPTGSIGTTLADIAKATNGVLGIDRLDRLTFAERNLVPASTALILDDTTAIVSARTPIVEEQIANVIDAEANPLAGVAGTELYNLGSTEGLALTPAEVMTIFVPYGGVAVDVAVSTLTQSGTVTASLAAYSEVAEITLSGGAAGGTVTELVLTGTKLETRPLRVRRESAASIRRYGRRPKTVTATLVQTVDQLEGLASAVRDAFSGIDAATGERSLPDVTIESLGLAYTTLGDRLAVTESATGISGEYQLVSHVLAYDGALRSSGRARRVDEGILFAVADASLADDAQLASY